MSKKKEKLCVSCNEAVGGKDGIQCEICDKWAHGKCVGITGDIYKFVSNNTQIHWFCTVCNTAAGHLVTEIKRIHDKIEIIEKKIETEKDVFNKDIEKLSRSMDKCTDECHTAIEKVTHELKELQKEVKTIKHNVEEKVESQIDTSVKQQEKKWAETLTKQVDVELKTRASEVQKMQEALAAARENANEVQDKENRRNNIIMYRVEESKAGTAEDRLSEDLKFSLGLFTAIQSGVDKEDVIKVTRLGRRNEDEAKPRPLLVQLGGRTAKNLVMENLNKLRNAAAKYKSVMVAHDMTKKEREECRHLVDEAKTKSAHDLSGEWVYVVRGQPSQMKILKVRKSY